MPVHDIDDGPNGQFDSLVNNHFNVNCRSQVKVTKIILKQMIQRNAGLIINISSLSAKFPVPYGTIYGGVKQFNEYFSEGLRHELSHTNIQIQTVTPSWIATNLVNGLLSETLITPSPGRFVSSAIQTVGWQDRTFGYFMHDFFGWFCDLNHFVSARGSMLGGHGL